MKRDLMIQIFVIVVLISFVFESFFFLTRQTTEETVVANTTLITFTGSSVTNATITYLLTEVRFTTNKTGLKQDLSAIPGVEWVLESKGKYVLTISSTANRSVINIMLKNLDENASISSQVYISIPQNLTFSSFTGENRSDIAMPDRIMATIYDLSLKIGDKPNFKIYIDVKDGQHIQTPTALQLVETPTLQLLFLNAEGTVVGIDGYELQYLVAWENRTSINTTEIKNKTNVEVYYDVDNTFSFVGVPSNVSYIIRSAWAKNVTTATVSENFTDKALVLNDTPNAEFPNSIVKLTVKTNDTIDLAEAKTWVPAEMISIKRMVKATSDKLYSTETNKTYNSSGIFDVYALPEIQLNDSINYSIQAIALGDKILNGQGEQIKTVPT